MISSSHLPNDIISNRELKQNLKNAIKNSGVLNEVKAHVRKDIILQLMSRNSISSATKVKTDLHSRIVRSILYQYLQANNLLKTLSVFEAESGIESANNILSEGEVADILRLQHIISDAEANVDDSNLDKIVRVLQYFSGGHYLSTSLRRDKELSFSTIHAENLHKRDNTADSIHQLGMIQLLANL